MVVHEDDDHPGPGFFRLAVELGEFSDDDAPPEGGDWTEMTANQRMFWQSQVDESFLHFDPVAAE